MTQSVRPKLVVRGAEAALAFYEKAFGAELGPCYRAGGQVVQAEMLVFGTCVLLKEEDDADRSPASLGRPGVLLDVIAPDPDGLADAAVELGAVVVFPVGDQPYGARGGRVRDPYGHEWLIQTPISLTPDQVQRALDEEFGA
jgi:PhnB protein